MAARLCAACEFATSTRPQSRSPASNQRHEQRPQPISPSRVTRAEKIARRHPSVRAAQPRRRRTAGLHRRLAYQRCACPNGADAEILAVQRSGGARPLRRSPSSARTAAAAARSFSATTPRQATTWMISAPRQRLRAARSAATISSSSPAASASRRSSSMIACAEAATRPRKFKLVLSARARPR